MKRFAFAATLLAATPLLAADAEDKFAVEGRAALASCEDFVGARENNPELHAAFVGWMEGFMLGANAFTPNVYDATPWQNVEYFGAAIQSACTENPNMAVGMVASGIMKRLTEEPLTEEVARVTFEDGDNRATIYETVAEDLRQVLNDGGYSAGEAGDMDALENGIKAFQSENNIPMTGVPNITTLHQAFSQNLSAEDAGNADAPAN
ncbi:peptidoglycan-binding domain-containing protein [Paracoccaceae bacterium GXU_MW_L88]